MQPHSKPQLLDLMKLASAVLSQHAMFVLLKPAVAADLKLHLMLQTGQAPTHPVRSALQPCAAAATAMCHRLQILTVNPDLAS